MSSRSLAVALRILILLVLCVLAASVISVADEPYARARDYDLQHSRIALRFNLDERRVMGEVTHSLSALRDGISKLSFDSVGLKIESVAVNARAAKFDTTTDKLSVHLDRPAKTGEKFEVAIRYRGQPKKGLYFILPDSNYPNLPKQIWTQGESEDTRYYLPTYDYPNDRLTTEMIVTVPRDWITVSNGKLVRVTDAPDGMKTWDWKESVPSSTYLITLVAGEFEEVKDTWRGLPVTYYAPKGRGERLRPNYGRTPQMMEFFSKRLGVNYPWEKYAQSMVDDFVAGGMENSSATTNTSSSLVHPQLVPEYFDNQDGLISHELAHQWFGDLVTCKDWGNIWLNEGFASFLEGVWSEEQFGRDFAAGQRWQAANRWFANRELFSKPIVRHDFDDSSEFDGNAYGKGAWVLYMLRRQLGEEPFWRGMKHYLEKYRGQNVVTSDYAKAMEEATSTNLDQFFDQWVYKAGAPNFDVRYTYDDEKHHVNLEVKQTQRVDGHAGLFRVPIEVEITTAAGRKSFPIAISKKDETFTFPADGAPRLVLFDKNFAVLKAVDFHKDTKEWIYQLKNAAAVPDRLDAAKALGKINNNDDVVSALGASATHDAFWGVRAESLRALGEIPTSSALKQIMPSLASQEPRVRMVAVVQLGNFPNDPQAASTLEAIARDDKFWRARAAALDAIAKLKAPKSYDVLQSAMASDSPDDILRRAALRGFGPLGDNKAAPTVLEWSRPGKPVELRQAAITSLGQLDKNNKEITKQIISYLGEKRFPVRRTAVVALGERGDSDAITALTALLKSDEITIAFSPIIEAQIERLKRHGEKPGSAEEASSPSQNGDVQPVLLKLGHLEKMVAEMSERLKGVEKKLVSDKQ